MGLNLATALRRVSGHLAGVGDQAGVAQAQVAQKVFSLYYPLSSCGFFSHSFPCRPAS